jgi:Fic family protein
MAFRASELAPRLLAVREKRAELLATVRMVGGDVRMQTAIEAMAQEVVTNSAIEGVDLPLEVVRESLMLRLGVHRGGLPHSGARRVDPVVDILLEAVQGWESPLTLERIFSWHRVLFPDGFSRHIGRVRVGELRGEEPMAVVSPSRSLAGPPTVHYEAPPRPRLEQEMEAFLGWFENPPEGLDGLLRAGIAHFWFVTIHPFEDGNGRLARTIGDLALAQEDRSALRYYSLSAQILRNKAGYYDALERAQHGGLDITGFLDWFLEELREALDHGIREAFLVVARTKFWQHAAGLRLNDRQEKGLRSALAPRTDRSPAEEGTLSNRHYRAVTGANRITATRDLAQLVELELLVAHGAGRGAAYRVPLERYLPGGDGR